MLKLADRVIPDAKVFILHTETCKTIKLIKYEKVIFKIS